MPGAPARAAFLLLVSLGALSLAVAMVPRSPAYHLRIPDFLFGPPTGRASAVHPTELPGYGEVVDDTARWVFTYDRDVPPGAIRAVLLAPYYKGFWGPTRAVRPLVYDNDTTLTARQRQELRRSILENVRPEAAGVDQILDLIRADRTSLVTREAHGYILNTLTCIAVVCTLGAWMYFVGACAGAIGRARLLGRTGPQA